MDLARHTFIPAGSQHGRGGLSTNGTYLGSYRHGRQRQILDYTLLVGNSLSDFGIVPAQISITPGERAKMTHHEYATKTLRSLATPGPSPPA